MLKTILLMWAVFLFGFFCGASWASPKRPQV